MSLASCLKLSAKNFTTQEKMALQMDAGKRASAGMDRAEAEIAAVQAVLDEAMADLREVTEAVYAELPSLRPAGQPAETAAKMDAAAKPAPEPAAQAEGQTIDDFGEKIGGARKDTAQPLGKRAKTDAEESAEPGWRKRFSISQIAASSREDEVGKWVIHDERKKDWKGQARQVGETFSSKEDAERAVPLAAVALKHRIGMGAEKTDGSRPYAIWRDVTDRKRVQVVKQEFATREDAMQFMAEHAAEIIETKTSFGEEILAKPDKVKRIGAERRTEPSTPKMFTDTFGFRGVEFGLWNNQDERQEVMNHAYDGLLDLAEVLNLPAKALSLNGDLALAFGARGQGLSGAKAHYESDYGVINLTKMTGAGSLAHEWFHAADHYFARQDTKAAAERVKSKSGDMVFPTKSSLYDFASHGFSAVKSQVREELRTAYNDLMQTMFTKAEQYVEDTQKAEKFVGASRGALAKALQEMRDGLMRGPEQLHYMKRNNKPASAEQIATFDQLSEKLIAGQDLASAYRPSPESAGKKIGSPGWMAGRRTNDTLEAISAIMKAVRGRNGFSSKNDGVMDGLRSLMTNYQQRIAMLESAAAQETKTKRVPTSYAMEAKRIDQGRASDYWTTPHEMAARAFSAYVEDKVAEQGNRSDFLAYGADNRFYVWRDMRPFPEGSERVAINQAFDKFMGEIKTRETDTGTAMFSKGQTTTGNVEYHVNEANREKTDALQAALNRGGEHFVITPTSLPVSTADDAAQGRDNAGSVSRDDYGLSEKIAGVFGKEVVWVEVPGNFFNGVIVGDVPRLSKYVFINANTPTPAHVILGHELSHHMEKDAPGLYKVLRRSIDGLLRNHEEYRAKYNIGKEYSDDYVAKEMIGDILGDNFDSREFWNRVAKESGGTFRMIASKIKSWLDNLIAKLRGFGSDQFVTDIHAARKALAQAVVDYAESQNRDAGKAWTEIANAQFSRAAPTLTAQWSGNIEGSPATDYLATDNGSPIGNVVLHERDGVPLVLYHIESLNKSQGAGTRVLADVMRRVKDDLYILNIQPESRDFWRKMGVEFIEGTDDATLTPQGFQQAVAGRIGSPAQASIGTAETGRGQGQEAVSDDTARQAVVNAFGEKATAALEGSGLINFVNSPWDFPAEIHPQMRGNEEAVYWKGKSWIVKSSSPSDIVTRVLHEIGEHHGLKAMLGEAGYSQLQNRVSTMNRMGNPAVKAAWAEVIGAEPGLKEGSDRFIAEVIARVGQDQRVQSQTWWRQLLDAIKAFVIKHYSIPAGKLTEGHIQTLLRASVMVAAREPGKPSFRQGEVVAASREGRPDQTQTEASNPDIRFSRGASISPDQPARFGAELSDRIGDLMRSDKTFNLWDKTVGTQTGKAHKSPEFKSVFDRTQEFIQDSSLIAIDAQSKAPELLPIIEGLSDLKKRGASAEEIKAISGALFSGTLFGKGSPMDGRVWTDAELKSGRLKEGGLPMFSPLNDKQIRLYREALDAINTGLDELAKSTIYSLQRGSLMMEREAFRDAALDDITQQVADRADEQIGVLETRMEALEDDAAKKETKAEIDTIKALKKSVADVESKATGLKEHGYFPLQRFGRYTVNIKVPDANGALKEVFFGMYERPGQAQRAAREFGMMPEYKNAKIDTGIMPQESFQMFQGLSPDIAELFADHIQVMNAEGQMVPLSKDAVFQTYLQQTVSSRSALKRHIHRKGIAGYSQDVPRVMAAFLTSNAQLSSSNYHMAEAVQAWNDIPNRMGDVKDEAAKLILYLRNPQEEAAAIRTYLFFNYLGGSVASALVNMTQPVLTTLPHLTQWTSYTDAAAKLVGPAPKTKEYLNDLARARKEGIVSPQEIHQLMAEARAQVFGLNLPSAVQRNLHKAATAWGSMFSIAEQFNREQTFKVAWQIAAEKGLPNPYEFASQAIKDTQFVYGKGAKSNWARGPVGATLFTFKQFTLSFVEMAVRMAKQNPRGFAYMMLTLFVAAGAEGLPFAEDAEDIIDTIMQWMGYGTNSKRWLRKQLADVLGRDAAEILLTGIASKAGVDIHSRLGMGNLIPGTSFFKKSETDRLRDAKEIIGPVGGLIESGQKAIDNLAQGKGLAAARAGLPKALANAAQGIEMMSTGEYRDTKGRKVMDVTPAQGAAKAIGLQPASVAQESRMVQRIYQDIRLQKVKEDEVADKWAQGIIEKDMDMVREAQRELRDWNTKNPDLRVQINLQQIRRRVIEAQRTRAERFGRTVPREMRQEARRELAP